VVHLFIESACYNSILDRKLRSVLFSIRDGTIFTGTFRDHDIMYDGIINAFRRAISRLRKEEQAIALARRLFLWLQRESGNCIRQ